jgi:hypothetical protein
MAGLPKGATYKDGKLTIEIKKEELAGGYNAILKAICTEGPSPVER